MCDYWYLQKREKIKQQILENINVNYNNCPRMGMIELLSDSSLTTEQLKFIEKSKYQSLMHVCKSFESPYEMIKNKGKNWKYLMKKKILNRQNYKYQFYFITGSLYYFSKKFFKKNKSTYDHSSYAYEIDKINFVDIDDSFPNSGC